MRTNWDIFAAEFTQAATEIGLHGTCEPFIVTTPLSLFEKKYQERGHQLWRFQGEFCR